MSGLEEEVSGLKQSLGDQAKLHKIELASIRDQNRAEIAALRAEMQDRDRQWELRMQAQSAAFEEKLVANEAAHQAKRAQDAEGHAEDMERLDKCSMRFEKAVLRFDRVLPSLRDFVTLLNYKCDYSMARLKPRPGGCGVK